MEHATLNTCPVRKSYRYILDHNTHVYMEHTTLTTCPVRTVQSLYYISPSTYGTHNTDHMSNMCSSITMLNPTTHMWNTYH
ncbi:hypothetical protein NP493_8686g00000 [Ridgeia piscesae]|uniref:Uncharacterized protein n=1 Tax=Ridgeia piscesae TaxID=27915 RepID=A0AAD9INT5_RIDPI|nr:hypothetical protein NP493_8686g00000 [Ridgeia piscesae]